MKKKLFGAVVLLMVFPVGAWALTIDLNVAFSNYNPGGPLYNAYYGTVTLTEGDFNPATLLLLGSGFLGLALLSRKRSGTRS